jgi:hypothetical protein
MKPAGISARNSSAQSTSSASRRLLSVEKAVITARSLPGITTFRLLSFCANLAHRMTITGDGRVPVGERSLGRKLAVQAAGDISVVPPNLPRARRPCVSLPV